MDELFRKIMRPSEGTWDAVESDREVFERILVRFPVKSLLMCKSVSKLWHGVISTKEFIIAHRHWSMRSPKYFVFGDAHDFEDGIVREMYQMEPDGVYSESYFILDFLTIYNPLLISSFNGLICCLNNATPYQLPYKVDLRICNPATREVLLLPRGQPSVYMPIFGVAYSNANHFYKIFRFFSDSSDAKVGLSQCEVYSSNTGAWKQLGRVPSCPMLDPCCPLFANHICINEKVYWFLADGKEPDIPTSILMVDMNEKFYRLRLPIQGERSFLVKFCGQLCFVAWNGVSIMIWVYYEKKIFWRLMAVRRFPATQQQVSHFDSVLAYGQDILFVFKDRSGFRHEVMYDVRRRMWKAFRIADNSRNKTLVVFPFSETLLPCGYMEG